MKKEKIGRNGKPTEDQVSESLRPSRKASIPGNGKAPHTLDDTISVREIVRPLTLIAAAIALGATVSLVRRCRWRTRQAENTRAFKKIPPPPTFPYSPRTHPFDKVR